MVVNRYGGILWVILFFLALQVASACESGPIGVSDRNIIPDSSFTATLHYGSYYDERYGPEHARLNGLYGWGSRDLYHRDHLQIDLGAIYNICAIATQGAGPNLGASEWVTTYLIRTSIDNSVSSPYNNNQIFNGNRDRDTIKKNTLDVPTVLRLIRFVPLKYHRWKTMRVEVYGEKVKACESDPIGVSDRNIIPDSSITATSRYGFYYDKRYRPEQARLDGPYGWGPRSNAGRDYLQIDLGAIYNICAIATQGAGPNLNSEWVTTYQIRTSIDNSVWSPYNENQIFNGNWGRYTTQENTLDVPTVLRFIRFVPIKYHVWKTMRVEVYGKKVKEPKGIPVILSVSSPSSTSIIVKWKFSQKDLANGPLVGYKIVCSTGDSSNAVIVNRPQATSRQLDNLEKYTTYSVTVAVRNQWYAGQPSIEETITTQEDVPDGVPTSVTITSPSSTSIHVTWTAPSSNAVNGRLVGYQIGYNQQLGVSSNPDYVNTTTSTSYLLKNLKKYTSYNVTVAVRNNRFVGSPSTAKTTRTQEDVPSIGPSNVHHSSINTTTFNIRWDKIASYRSNGIVINYEVQWTLIRKGNERRSEVQQRRTSANNVAIHGFELCAMYSIKVRAYTRVGPGPYSDPLNMLTSEPGSPQNVRADLSGKRTVKLKWKKPLNVADNVQSYTIEYNGSKSYWDSFVSLLGHAFINESTEEHIVRGLIPGTRYGFRILATTDCGKGPKSRQVFATTKIDVPIAPEVQNVQLENKTDVMVNITLWPAQPRNGLISAYQVIVLKESKENKSLPSGYDTNISDYETSSKNHLNYYIAAQLNATSIGPSTLFLIGDGKTYNDYENVALKQGQSYQVFFRAMTFENGITYAGKAALVAKIQVARAKRTGSDGQHGYSAGAAAGGGVAAVIILFLVTAGVLFWRRKRKDKHAGSDGNDITLENLDAELNRRQNIANSVPAQLDDTSTNDHRPIPTTAFTGYVSTMKSNDAEQLKEAYKKLPSGLQFPSNVARKPVNKHKNRYGNIVPYDSSRVILECVNNDANSDYINASYLRGYDGRRNAYIASQGPVPPAFNDFWRMIWEQNTASIVMLTNLKELGKSKCHQYWPNETELYGDITVNNYKTEVFPDYVIRTFNLSRVTEDIYQNTSQERRWVRQFHFTVWPDKGVPQYATAILAFIRKVIDMNTNTDVPIVVHCSAGVGRTGTYIVIDAMLQRAKKLCDVDIFNYVTAIRNDRPDMVQTKEQYVFIHLAILEAITCGNTEIQAQDLRIAMKKLAPVNRKTMISGYATEFQHLGAVTSDSPEECDVGRKPENANRNRTSDVIPLNRCRVMLHATEETGTDYINASFADAYRQKNAFIMTQAPLENTVQDFWRMVLDYKIGTIVMLNDDQEENEYYPRYWPKQGAVKFGQISVEKLGSQYSGDIISRQFRVSKDSTSQDVQHFQHIRWADKCIPTKPQSVIELLNQVQSSQQKSDNAAVVVQCSNGVGRSGTFCAISSILERLKQEQVVDVFQTVKCIRVNRPGAVESLTQYVFCYQIIQKYLESFSDYANFTAD